MTMYMDQTWSGTDAPPMGLNLAAYGDEVLNAGWNPAVPNLINDVARYERSSESSRDLSTIDVDEFLDRVYALATQI